MSQGIPTRLYHYCNLTGLRGIIESKSLWMTSIFWMDDTTEVFWLYEVVTRVLEDYPPETRNRLHVRFNELMRDRRLSQTFCACFSEDPDSRSQWLEYADDGHGFAIGFDVTMFELQRSPPMRNLELLPVIYDEAQQWEIAREEINQLQERREDIDELSLSFARHNIWWQAPECKNPKFKSEAEWRLILRDDPGDDRLRFRERNNRQLIPYTEFPFDPTAIPIREIWLGPRNPSQRNVDAVTELLRSNGYTTDQITFKASEVPLRAEY